MSFWRWVVAGGVVLGLMVGASVFADPHDWEHSVGWAQEREREWGDVAAECPVLEGDGQVGSSMSGYVAASRLAAACLEVDAGRLGELAEATGAAAVPTAADRASLVALAPAVAALRQAAHRVGGPGTWPAVDVGPGALSGILDVMVVVDALRLEARDHVGEGDVDAAVACLLDGLAAGIDLGHSLLVIEQMLGMLTVDRCLRSLDDALLAAATPDTLRRLQARLAAADAALPPESTCLVDSAATMVLALHRHPNWSAADLGLPTPLLAWRQGFSVRRLGMARAVQMVEVAMRFQRGTPRGREPWAQRRARLEQATAEIERENRDLRFRMGDHLLQHEEYRREVATGLRLLRLAVAWQLGDPLPELDDPFGDGPLRLERTESGAAITSARQGQRRVLSSPR